MTGRRVIANPRGNLCALIENPMYELLVGAIVQQATRDYLHAKSGSWEAPYYRKPESEWDVETLAELAEFFGGDWFTNLCGLDGEAFVDGLEGLLL